MENFVILSGLTSSDNCANTRYSSATVSCHKSTLSPPSLGSEFRLSALDTKRTRKTTQFISQLSTFEHSMVLVSTGGQTRLTGTCDLHNCGILWGNSATASCPSSILPTRPRTVGFDSALPRQVVPGRKGKSHDSGAHSRARWY